MDDFIRELEQEMTENGGLPPILPGRFLPYFIDKGWPIESRLCDHTGIFNSGIRARSNSLGRHQKGQEVELPQVFCLFDKDWEGPKEAELPRDLTKSETERKTANRSRV